MKAMLISRQYLAILTLALVAATHPAFGQQSAALFGEHEYNGAPGFADDIKLLGAAGIQVDGALQTTNDVDCFAFQTRADGLASFQVKGRGSSPLQGAILFLYNAKGYRIIRGSGGWSSFDSFRAELPAGRYVITLLAPATGAYRLNCGFKKQTIPPLSLRSQRKYALRQERRIFRLNLPAAGIFRLTIKSAGLQSNLRLLSSSLTPLYRVDIDSTSTTRDGGLRAHLPKGVYYIALNARSAGTATVTTTFLPKAIPLLPCNGSLNGRIPGGWEDFLSYRVTLAKTSELRVQIAPGSVGKTLRNSYLFFLDREFDEVMESDNAAISRTRSIVAGTLPAASYYAVSTGFFGTGNYTISTLCSAPVLTAAPPGAVTLGKIPAKDGHVSFLVDLGTPAGLDFRFTRQTLAREPQIGLVDAATGLGRGWKQAVFASIPQEQVGLRFPRGKTHVLVKGYNGDSGTVSLAVLAPKHRDPSNTHLRTVGKSGDFAILMLSNKSMPGLALARLTGFLQVDLTQGLVIGPGLIPASGDLDFGFKFPFKSGVVLQSLLFRPASYRGEFSNILR